MIEDSSHRQPVILSPAHRSSLALRIVPRPCIGRFLGQPVLQSSYGCSNITATTWHCAPNSPLASRLLPAGPRRHRLLALRVDHRASDRPAALALECLCALWPL